jgi:hypothetical protein
VGIQDRLGVSGHEKGGNARADDIDSLGDLVAHHLGHDHVGEEEVDHLGGIAGQPHGFAAAGDRADLITVTHEDAAGQLAQALLVLDQEDRLAVAPVITGAEASSSVAGSSTLMVVPIPTSE